MEKELKRKLRSLTDTVCTFEVTGNDSQDVELCLIHGPFASDLPSAIKRHYDQILSLHGDNQLVKVKGNMPTLEETVFLLRNLDEVHSMSITSPTARLKEYDLQLKLSCCFTNLNSIRDDDILCINDFAEFASPTEAFVDLYELALNFSLPFLFVSINVKAGSFFNLSFAGNLKNSFTPPFVMQSTSVLRFCQSCGAPLHGVKCAYCGSEY